MDRIKALETEVEKLKKQTPQELIKEINELKIQLQQLQQQNTLLTNRIQALENR